MLRDVEGGGGEVLLGLLRACHPFDSADRRLAVIYIYGDLSGTTRNRVYVAACYVGTEAQWVEADRKWAAALDRAKVDCFHATDFFACEGAFRGWKKASRRHYDTEYEFTSIADAAKLSGFANGVETALFDGDFKGVVNRLKPKYRIRSLRLLCVQLVLQGIADVIAATPLPPHERVAVILENEQGIGEVVDYFTHAKRQGAPWTKRFLSVGPGEKCALRPLQVADLFAHLCFNDLTRWLSSPTAAVRPSYQRMLDGGRHDVRVSTAAETKKTLPALGAFVEQYPSGIAWPKRGRS